MGGTHSERQDFAKSAWKDVIDPFLLSFGSSINLTSEGKNVSALGELGK